jgi:hypothetical protein
VRANTAGQHAPSRKRVYVASETYYFVEFNPNILGAAELAVPFVVNTKVPLRDKEWN